VSCRGTQFLSSPDTIVPTFVRVCFFFYNPSTGPSLPATILGPGERSLRVSPPRLDTGLLLFSGSSVTVSHPFRPPVLDLNPLSPLHFCANCTYLFPSPILDASLLITCGCYSYAEKPLQSLFLCLLLSKTTCCVGFFSLSRMRVPVQFDRLDDFLVFFAVSESAVSSYAP